MQDGDCRCLRGGQRWTFRGCPGALRPAPGPWGARAVVMCGGLGWHYYGSGTVTSEVSLAGTRLGERWGEGRGSHWSGKRVLTALGTRGGRHGGSNGARPGGAPHQTLSTGRAPSRCPVRGDALDWNQSLGTKYIPQPGFPRELERGERKRGREETSRM